MSAQPQPMLPWTGPENFRKRQRYADPETFLQIASQLLLDEGVSGTDILASFREALLRAALGRTRGNICRAALLLGIHRSNVKRWIARSPDIAQLARSLRAEARSDRWALRRRVPKRITTQSQGEL